MVLAAGMNLSWILTFLYLPETGEDNQARDASDFLSLFHKSHLVVKM